MRCIPVSVSGQTACGCLLCPPVCPIQTEKPWPALLLLSSSKAMSELYLLFTHGWNFTSPICLLKSCWEQDSIYRFMWLPESLPGASLYPLDGVRPCLLGISTPSFSYFPRVWLFSSFYLPISQALEILEILHQAHLYCPKKSFSCKCWWY